MEGINFITDERNEKTAVMIDISKYGTLWEDFYDTLIAASRAHEQATSWQEVRQSLEAAGRL